MQWAARLRRRSGLRCKVRRKFGGLKISISRSTAETSTESFQVEQEIQGPKARGLGVSLNSLIKQPGVKRTLCSVKCEASSVDLLGVVGNMKHVTVRVGQGQNK